jgi:hypothetical protein
MATYPVNNKMRCKHPHPHMNITRKHDLVYHDGCNSVHCIGQDPTCMRDFCHRDNYICHPHQHCNFDDPHDHYDDHWCPYDRYKTYHGHMHIDDDPCFHGHEMKTTPLYDYDYERDAYIPNYRGDSGLVLNIDYKVKNVIDVNITYENGATLSGEIAEGEEYEFIYADSGVLKRDTGILNKITVSNGTISDTRLGFSQLSSAASIYLEFDCSFKGNSHLVDLDINLLRSISVIKEEDETEDTDEVSEAIITDDLGNQYTSIDDAIEQAQYDTILYGGNKFEISGDIITDKNISLDGFIINNAEILYSNLEEGNVSITNNTFNNGSSIAIQGKVNVTISNNSFYSDISYIKDGGVTSPVSINSTGIVKITDNKFTSVNNSYYSYIDISRDTESYLADGSIIENNKFLGMFASNAIVINSIEDKAKITIKNNVFDYSSNTIRLENDNNTSASLRVIDNKYYNISSSTPDIGFIQFYSDDDNDFSGYNVYIEGLYLGTEHLTEVGEGYNRVWWCTVEDTDKLPNVVFLD